MPMPFTWPVDRTGFPALPGDQDPEYAKDLAEQRAAAQVAVGVMWALSGRQFGLYDTVVRPCPAGRSPHSGWLTSYVLSWEGNRWVNWPCGVPGQCVRSGPNAVHLPGPVHQVTKVEIGGVDLAPQVWVAEGNVLYRREGPWPTQDLNRPLGDTNTWAVHYQRGIPVPEGVDQLTGILAKEMLTAVRDDITRCRLPRTVTVANRQGITYRAYDPAVIYANGKTGLPEVDMWLATVNPHHLMASPTVL